MGGWKYNTVPYYSAVNGKGYSAFRSEAFNYGQRALGYKGVGLGEPSAFVVALEKRTFLAAAGN
jgi:hypothetical protein